MITHYTGLALLVANKIPQVLEQRGLDPQVVTRYDLWEGNGGTIWLSAILDPTRVGKAEHYTHPQTLHQLSTVLRGKPVILSNSNGLRYCILLSNRPTLPTELALPPWRKGVWQIGRTLHGEVTVRWEELGNVLVAAMKRQGKSTLLKSLAAQALQEGYQLIVADPQGLTFAGLRGHPQILAYGEDLPGCALAVQALSTEMLRRATLFRQHAVDKLETYNQRPNVTPLPRLMVLIDEFNDFVQNAPQTVTDIVRQAAFGAPKYGVHMVISGHYFDENSVGKLKGQFDSRFCFRLTEPSAARMLLGNDTPTHIRVPGRAMTNRWGLLQVYHTDLQPLSRTDGLTAQERGLVARLKADYAGRMTFEALYALGYTRKSAARLRDDFLQRGLAKVAPGEKNALLLTI